MFGIIDSALNIFLAIIAGALLLYITLSYVINSFNRIKNSKWVINKLMTQYNYDVDLCRRLVIQVDDISKCRLLGRDKEKFLIAIQELILKTTGDKPLE